MYIVIDNNGFLKYATPVLPVGNKYTEVRLTNNFVKPKLVNDTWFEGATPEEVQFDFEEKKAALKNEYSQKIDAIVNEYVQKKIITGEEIPAEILAQREVFINEYHTKVSNLQQL